jgi:hypothetical protein
MKKIKFAVAIAALSLSASASAMPSQVPSIYYDMRAFLVGVWSDHACTHNVWWCYNI